MPYVPKTDRRAVWAHVFAYFTEHPNLPVNVNDIAHHTGFTREQVQASVSHARRRNGYDRMIEVLNQGSVWIYRPDQAVVAINEAKHPEKRLFEEVGQATVGLIVQDTDGNLFVLKEL